MKSRLPVNTRGRLQILAELENYYAAPLDITLPELRGALLEIAALKNQPEINFSGNAVEVAKVFRRVGLGHLRVGAIAAILELFDLVNDSTVALDLPIKQMEELFQRYLGASRVYL
jgi:hypothetical protein